MEPYSLTLLVPLATIVLPICLVCRIVRAWRRAYYCPLAAVPNAGFLAPFSSLLWSFPREFRGSLTLELPLLHETMGPLVRIGPNAVSFYSLEVYDIVYGTGSRFRKDPRTYGEFVQGCPALFSITDKEEHGRRRRMMGQLFNRSKMDNLRDLMLSEIDHFVTATKQRSSCVVDATAACRSFEADVISRFSFGTAIGAVSSWSNGRSLDMVKFNDEKATWMPLYSYFPGLVLSWKLLEQFIFQITGWRTTYTSAMMQWESWASGAHAKAMSSRFTQPAVPNFIHTLVNSGLHPETALSEARENIGPGTDTTSATLAHILFALAYNPEYQQTLREDLADLDFPTQMTRLESIPKLTACIKEGIRWAGAASAMLPRVVPPEGTTLEGYFLPGGTTISSAPIWYLRDATAYPEPLYFDPYRWLTANGACLDKAPSLRDKYYIPFSKGSNFCTGTHFACYELYLALSQILKHFAVELPRSSDRGAQDLKQARLIPVRLPSRREWVAAVLTEQLDVTLTPLATACVKYGPSDGAEE